MDNKKIIDAAKVERLVQHLNNKTKAEEIRALAAEEMLENITQEIKDMFGGKSIKYITQEEYDNLADEQKYDPTVSYFIIDADYTEHEHENKEFLDSLSQALLDTKANKSEIPTKLSDLEDYLKSC